MSAMSEKVVGLHPNRVYGAIRAFLNEKAINSENTRIAYEDDISQFFAFTRNKALADLAREDLNFSYDEVLHYKLFLADQYSGNSVNRKLSTIRKLFKVLGRTFDDLKQNAFEVDNVKAVTDNYGVLSLDEAQQMIELVKTQRKGREKSALIYLATMTSYRLHALLSITWRDIRQVDGLWTVTAIDKGQKKDTKPVSDNLHQTLLALRNAETKDDEPIFTLNPKTCAEMVQRLCEQMNLDPARNIVFHSLRKVGINWALDYTKDIMLAARQGNHSSPTTTVNNYLKKHEDLGSMPGILMEQDCDMSVLRSLSNDQLLSLIENSSYDMKMKLIMSAKKLPR